MKSIITMTLLVAITLAVGCSSEDKQEAESPDTTPSNSSYVATTEPANSTGVGEVRKAAKDGDAVTLIGHIGGSVEPFVEGLAAFTIVDPSVEYCQPEEGCPAPWDYCCTQDQVKDNIATIKVVDDKGKPVSADARKLLGVKELSLVVVEGTAQRDEQGNLSVLANKVFIKK